MENNKISETLCLASTSKNCQTPRFVKEKKNHIKRFLDERYLILFPTKAKLRSSITKSLDSKWLLPSAR